MPSRGWVMLLEANTGIKGSSVLCLIATRLESKSHAVKKADKALTCSSRFRSAMQSGLGIMHPETPLPQDPTRRNQVGVYHKAASIAKQKLFSRR